MEKHLVDALEWRNDIVRIIKHIMGNIFECNSQIHEIFKKDPQHYRNIRVQETQ